MGSLFNVAETGHNLEELIYGWALEKFHGVKIVETGEPFEAFYDFGLRLSKMFVNG